MPLSINTVLVHITCFSYWEISGRDADRLNIGILNLPSGESQISLLEDERPHTASTDRGKGGLFTYCQYCTAM